MSRSSEAWVEKQIEASDPPGKLEYQLTTAKLLPLEHVEDWSRWAERGGISRDGAPSESAFTGLFAIEASEAEAIAENLDCGDEFWQDPVELEAEIAKWADAIELALAAFEDEKWILDEVGEPWCAAPGYHHAEQSLCDCFFTAPC